MVIPSHGMPLGQNFAGGRTLGGGRLQPRTTLSGCSTYRTLSHLCICNMFVKSHPLCPKWAAAPWHRGAKSKVKVCHGDAQLMPAGGPTTMRINQRYSTSNLATSSFLNAQCIEYRTGFPKRLSKNKDTVSKSQSQERNCSF